MILSSSWVRHATTVPFRLSTGFVHCDLWAPTRPSRRQPARPCPTDAGRARCRRCGGLPVNQIVFARWSGGVKFTVITLAPARNPAPWPPALCCSSALTVGISHVGIHDPHRRDHVQRACDGSGSGAGHRRVGRRHERRRAAHVHAESMRQQNIVSEALECLARQSDDAAGSDAVAEPEQRADGGPAARRALPAGRSR